MDEKTTMKFVPKKQLTKVQAIIVIAIGGLMLLLSIVIPTAPDSTAHTVKVIAGVLGMCVVIVGLCYRPMEASKNPKE
jgi:glycerol uptake facilitator-like aquaporin